jgi:CRP-like cAMP-binding protein
MIEQKSHANNLLRQLSSAEFAKVAPWLQQVSLEFKESLYEFDRPLTHVYFVTSGVVSLVTDMHDGSGVVETGTVGREGLVGIPAFLGAERAPGRAFVQVSGTALRMESGQLRAAAARSNPLRELLLLYTNALISMVAQSAACTRNHPIEERMARWLLMTHDRVDEDEFPLTQEFLGLMVGARRPSVNVAGRSLQAAGLIRYTRGRITVLDRRGLEAASCECYRMVRKQMLRVRLRRGSGADR